LWLSVYQRWGRKTKFFSEEGETMEVGGGFGITLTIPLAAFQGSPLSFLPLGRGRCIVWGYPAPPLTNPPNI
jgi:hypothetical protein